ncbi:TrkH family potassium uptake protein [Tranquillimonas alkanivorans]|uniref:Trk system potassium uptake protein TrkH n=1 Tax=Tranquillimonas alkanivorans TaxID=441119 RepID=A0A1I5RP61_9RHOB|nr:potassium transporter TrkG [Tranquillimonas alkanivorans]SFP60342.1 trk system potassium uptake protein TrkH [Tranquillimonas alkanivorans]
MRRLFSRLPFAVILIALGAVAMLPPAIHAFSLRDYDTARAFFYSAILFLLLFALLSVAFGGRFPQKRVRSHLVTLAAAYVLLPVMLAVPFHESVPATRFFGVWFEMASCLTTTGATLFAPERLPEAVHLWRAIVGWLGGFLTWVTAIAILAPLNLGGFEVVSGEEVGEGAATVTQITRVADGSERLLRFSWHLAPVYFGLTLALWIGLIMAGAEPLNAVIHAMSTLATSGISPGEGPESGLVGEALIFGFLIFAVSRMTFSGDVAGRGPRRLRKDPEMQMGAIIVALVPLFLFLRHWAGAYDVADESNIAAGLGALWGAVFTTLSFLTTTGFVSEAWDTARDWSGLPTPGLVLMGLSLIGGGVATTAGGVKLLRIYALYKHGVREMERLVHPNSVGGAGTAARRIRRKGAYVAWIFFMLFAISIALSMGAFALTGLSFEASTVLTIAALSTTGPLAEVAAAAPIVYADLTDAALAIFAAGMVLGRLETLALIALFNPDLWRS